ncbi:MAG: N-acetylmuramoyl-L-alanine amidase [Candidatus Fimivivens sp.]
MPKIWIDPGHGGSDPGAVNENKRMEKDDNLRYALLLGLMLEQRGIEIVMTRTTDKHLDAVKSVDYINRTKLEHGCDLAVCCHRNSGGIGSTANGVEIWLHHAATANTITWAKDVIAGVKACGMAVRPGQVAPGVYRGYRTNPNADYYCNSGTKSPSMLIELGFITSAADNTLFDSQMGGFCKAIADAACRKLGVAF